jgi:hypothetical protein
MALTMEDAMDDVATGDVPMKLTDTLAPPSSSLFDRVDEPTLPQNHFLDSTAAQEPSSTSMSASSSLTDMSEEEIPYDTFNYTPPQGNQIVKVVIPRPKIDALPYSSSQSGLVYDVGENCCTNSLNHFAGRVLVTLKQWFYFVGRKRWS